MSGFVIVTDSRKRDETLFMVDRRRQRASFWSNRTDDALVYSNIEAARAKVRALQFNHPRIMTFTDAQKLSIGCENERMHQAALIDSEQGWDAHKGAL